MRQTREDMIAVQEVLFVIVLRIAIEYVFKMPSQSILRLLCVFSSILLSLGCTDNGKNADTTGPGDSDTHTDYYSRSMDARPNVIIFFTDDQGYADVGIHDQVSDIQTPHIDSLAENGVRMTNGYVTAPQCTPSRAAMITGMYQQRFGLESNQYAPMPLDVETIGDRFQQIGYTTGMVGKWHLEISQSSSEWFAENNPNTNLSAFDLNSLPMDLQAAYFPNQRGYTDTFFGYVNEYWTTYDLAGATRAPSYISNKSYRVDTVTEAAVTFIERNHQMPFYLHVAHFAPHVPLDAPQKYLDRFPGEMPERRRYALAMCSAVDDGVGRVLSTLKQYDLLENTIIFFISDNGAPRWMDLTDAPVNERNEGWNGSLNTPFVGEKGMLTEGGIHVPYLVQWPQRIPGGIVVDEPVSSMDAVYTALTAAGASQQGLENLDGADLLPAVDGDLTSLSTRPLFWRFEVESAVRRGNWKYLKMAPIGVESTSTDPSREFLFDMSKPESTENNLINEKPELALELKRLFEEWESTVHRPNLGAHLSEGEQKMYNDSFSLHTKLFNYYFGPVQK